MARRIAVAFNDDAAFKKHLNPTELLGELEVVETAHEIAEILAGDLVPVADDIRAAIDRCRRYDVVIDLCEGVHGQPRFEKNFALALEMFGIPHTSCDPIAVGIVSNKRLVKDLLLAAGIPTPMRQPSRIGVIHGTYIVKPANEDAGIGIEPAAIVETADALEARVRYVEQTYRQPALIEQFIDGRELNQAVLCGRALPAGEVVFAETLAANERIVGWKAKWDSGSAEDLATQNRTPALIDEATRAEVERICLAATGLFGLDMTVRFDLRQAKSGELYIIDINPNPDLGKGTGFRRALDAAGLPFADALETLIMAASSRRQP
jgi:D-alanine-D-alanine ligase